MSWNDLERREDPLRRALGILTWFPAISDAELARRTGLSEDDDSLAKARERLALGTSHTLVCAGEACAASAKRLALQQGDTGILSPTGCQGHCDHAPISVLRCGAHHEGLAQYAGEEGRIANLARHAAAFGHLWDAEDPVSEFRFDPLHGHADAAPLAAFAFLTGHFRGRGQLGAHGAPVAKELLGRFEASGRALVLRMRVDFTLKDGDRDHHEALVTITCEDGDHVGRAVTDGGAHDLFHYQIEDDGSVLFDDRAPGHGRDKRRARKRLTPTPAGYDERLEVEGVDSRYNELYCIPMITAT